MKPLVQISGSIFKAILTLGRSKKLNGKDYVATDSFELSQIKSEKLAKFKAYFNLKEELPLAYVYLLSQSAQVSMMLEASFPLPIPGMIHLSTHIDQLADVDIDDSLQIVCEVEIKNKEQGSLKVLFNEKYFQNGIEIFQVKSLYIVKRKSKGEKKSKKENPITANTELNWLPFPWKLKGSLGYSYAKLSGDYNPIHLSNIMAMLFGFRRKIIHGWYIASRTIAFIESETDMPAKSIEISFLKALCIPSKVLFEFRLGHNRNLEFRISDQKDKSYMVSGYIS
jgi:hypothetical protein